MLLLLLLVNCAHIAVDVVVVIDSDGGGGGGVATCQNVVYPICTLILAHTSAQKSNQSNQLVG